MMILDASALIKLVIEEKHSDKSRAIIREEIENGGRILVPDIILAESLNGLWSRHVVTQDLTEPEYNGAIKDLLKIFENLGKVPSIEIANIAVEFSNAYKKYKLTIYDALYMALSKLYDAKLLTFDGKIIKITKENEAVIPIYKWYEKG